MMHSTTVLFLAAAASAVVDATYTLYKIPVPNGFNARSLDGSPAAFYFEEGSGADSNNWVIYFQGGGWCYDVADCYERSKGSLGSSNNLAPTSGSMGGLVSSDCTVSPLCNYNKVWLAYTDGNSFSGLLTDPVSYVSPNGTTVDLWFRGRANLDAVLDAVSHNVMGSTNVWANAHHVVETGCSAGGLATYLHANYLYDTLNGQYTGQFLSLPISGYFLDAVSKDGVKQYGSQIQVIHALSNASTDASCEAAYPAAEQWKCNMAEYVFPFIRPPIFVLNSFYDSWQTGCIMTSEPVVNGSFANGNCSAVPGWQACAKNPASCTPDQIASGYVAFGNEMVTSLSQTNAAKYAAPGSGGFLTSCHTHCEAQSSSCFTNFAIGGKTMMKAASAWIQSNQASGGKSAPQWLTDCSYSTTAPYQCNPTCA